MQTISWADFSISKASTKTYCVRCLIHRCCYHFLWMCRTLTDQPTHTHMMHLNAYTHAAAAPYQHSKMRRNAANDNNCAEKNDECKFNFHNFC